MQEEIKWQVALYLSSLSQSTSEHEVNTSPPHLRSSCASIELPNQDDALQHFPVDDITEKMMPCELHIPMGNSTVMVSTVIVSRMDLDKTPRIHGNPIPPGYYSVNVDRVIKDYRKVALDFPRGDGCNTPGICLASLHQHEHFMIMCIILSHALLLKDIIETSTTFLLHLCYMSMLHLLIIGPC
jgi:hypothetical protein